eukprot:jgi/Chlat1/5652/Chrsp37S05476
MLRVGAIGVVGVRGGVGAAAASGGLLRLRPQSQQPFSASHRTKAFSSSYRRVVIMASSASDNCIFCKIVGGQLPSHKLLETEHALAFLDAFPMTKGHALLVPKQHFADMSDAPADVIANVCRELPKLASAVQSATGADGVNVNNGAAAGQVVFHVHFHLIPRFEGDGLVKLGRGNASKLQPGDADQIKDSIVKQLS